MDVEAIRAVIGEVEKIANKKFKLAEADPTDYGARATRTEATTLLVLASRALDEVNKLEASRDRD
jgi:hypothetical protein